MSRALIGVVDVFGIRIVRLKLHIQLLVRFHFGLDRCLLGLLFAWHRGGVSCRHVTRRRGRSCHATARVPRPECPEAPEPPSPASARAPPLSLSAPLSGPSGLPRR